MHRIQNFLLFRRMLAVTTAVAALAVAVPTGTTATGVAAAWAMEMEVGGSRANELFIGKDPETGDSIMRVTPPPQQPQTQPSIPYIVPQVNTPWQPEVRPPIILPPGYVPPSGVYPPGSYPPGNYPPDNYPPGYYPPGSWWPGLGTPSQPPRP